MEFLGLALCEQIIADTEHTYIIFIYINIRIPPNNEHVPVSSFVVRCPQKYATEMRVGENK